MLTEKRSQFIRGGITGLTDNYDVELTNRDGEDDHVHILFRAKPTTRLVNFINTVKGATTRRVRNEYEHDQGTRIVKTGSSTLNERTASVVGE